MTPDTTIPADFKCGYIAIVGRPNVGKSTLLNRILGQKISITSHKPQTTRHQILGIHTTARSQLIFVDTPGLHLGAKRAINRYMNRAAGAALQDVNAVLFLVEALKWTSEDSFVLDRLKELSAPVYLLVNKVDQIGEKARLMPYLAEVSTRMDFAEVYPLSALNGDNVEPLLGRLEAGMPEGPPFYEEDRITDRSQRFITAELIREKLMRRLGQEVPYRLTVEIEDYTEDKELTAISAIIWVEGGGQKAIVIGKGGRVLKDVGMRARRELEESVGHKVHLQLWVKVKEGWSDDVRALQRLGYED